MSKIGTNALNILSGILIPYFRISGLIFPVGIYFLVSAIDWAPSAVLRKSSLLISGSMILILETFLSPLSFISSRFISLRMSPT